VRIRALLGLAVAAATTVVLAAPVSAQTPSPAPQAQAPTPAAQAPAPAAQAAQALRSPVEGDLVSVDQGDAGARAGKSDGRNSAAEAATDDGDICIRGHREFLRMA